jgi:3-isopropylmalate/(R)-2-methylmalate dehydratase small subunit
MQLFTVISGIAAPLPAPNVDTDVIMPKQFLKGITRDGLSKGVFHDLRFDEAGKERPEFILNKPGYRSPSFLVVGPNFGCGSSREHAVWGLLQFGIRGIFGTTFASIFYDNCFKNGLLPVGLKAADLERLRFACSLPERASLRVSLPEQTVLLEDGSRINFSIDPLRRDDLLNGRDAISTTLLQKEKIAAFETTHWFQQPWFKPGLLPASDA